MSGRKRARPKSEPTESVVPTPMTSERGSERVRLQKFLARAGVSSRRGGESLMQAGKVQVNGKVVTELGHRVDPVADRVTVDGAAVVAETPVYMLLNKPDGCVSSAEPKVDDRGRTTVVSLLGPIAQRVYPVGRLDFHSRGVLLLTNDGDFAATLLHPRSKIPRTYHVKFQGQVGASTIGELCEGVVLDDGTRTRPLVDAFVFKLTASNTWVQMTLAQGLYRQIRRMGEAVGYPVLKLIRVAVGDVTSDGLADGEWRHLRESELAGLRGLMDDPAVPAAPSSAPVRSKAPSPGARPNEFPAARRPGERRRVRAKARPKQGGPLRAGRATLAGRRKRG